MTSTKAETEVRSALQSFVGSYQRQDLDGLLAAWSEDFVDMQHGLPTAIGADALSVRRTMIGASFVRFESELDVQLDDVVELAPHWVLVTGRIDVHLVNRTTRERSLRSKRFMELWNWKSGGWKIRFGMTNLPE